MKINDFTGGLNTRVAPELIAFNEAVVCNNVDLSSGHLKAVNNLNIAEITSVQYPYYNVVDKTWWPNADKRDYLNYKQYLYWADGAVAKKYLKGKEQDLGITGPLGIGATLGSAGLLNGGIQYVYTYYNSLDGTESQPSPVSATITAVNQVINVNLTASTDIQVTNIFLYRIGGALLSFTKVAETLNISQLYTDNLADGDVVGSILDSELNGKAPVLMTSLIEAYGIFFGIVGTRLHFSRLIGNPNYWTQTDYIEFSLGLTGIASVPSGIVVFTETKAFLVTGTSASTFRQIPISGSLGCINRKTIVAFNNALLFVSLDGLCSLVGSKITVISKFKLGKLALSTKNAVVYDEAYHLQKTDGTILVFDIKYTPAFKTYNFSTNWLVVAEDIIYGQTDKLYSFFTGSVIPYTYQTGDSTEGNSAELKIYNRIYFAIVGTVTVTIYLDQVSVASKTFTNPTAPVYIAVPQDKQRAMSISIKLEGTAKIKQIVIPVERAQNA